MPKLPIDLHSNENFSYLFICPTGAANTQTTSFRPRCLLYPKPKFNAKRRGEWGNNGQIFISPFIVITSKIITIKMSQIGR